MSSRSKSDPRDHGAAGARGDLAVAERRFAVEEDALTRGAARLRGRDVRGPLAEVVDPDGLEPGDDVAVREGLAVARDLDRVALLLGGVRGRDDEQGEGDGG